MVPLQRISPRWDNFCIVAATGPSLTAEVAQQCRGYPTVAVSDAYRLLPWAEVLYSSDAAWWDHHRGCMGFKGERWSSHGHARHNDKIPTAEKYGLRLIQGDNEDGFSRDPSRIHYLNNSGCQGIGIAIHCLGGRGRIALVGFDMRVVDGRRHFFGDHPHELHRNTRYAGWFPMIDRAARSLPAGLEIVNCTPDSALRSFPMMDLADALPVAA